MADETFRKSDGKTPATLTDTDITTQRKVGRRSLLGMAGGAVLGAVALATGARPGMAQGYTDADQGQYSDGPGRGRGPAPRNSTGLTDGDQGNNADRPGFGRGAPRGGGGGGSGVSDNDQGPNADGPGRGRGPQPRQSTGVSDSDQGPNQDRPGFGRGPRRP